MANPVRTPTASWETVIMADVPLAWNTLYGFTPPPGIITLLQRRKERRRKKRKGEKKGKIFGNN